MECGNHEDGLLNNSQLEALCVDEDAAFLSGSLQNRPLIGRRAWKVRLHACLRRLRQNLKTILCLCIILFACGFAGFVALQRTPRSLSCLECPSAYLTATACLLGGQKLSRTNYEWLESPVWNRLYSIFRVGTPLRVELEALLASSHFRDAARCPRWARWDHLRQACEVRNSSTCPIAERGSWREDGDQHGNCTTNLLLQPERSHKNGSPAVRHVWAVPCSNDPSQHGWSYANDNIISPEGLCITLQDGSSDYLHLVECADLDSQRFHLINGQFHHLDSNMCVNILGLKGPRVFLYDCERLQVFGFRRLSANDEWVVDGGVIQSAAIWGDQYCLASEYSEPSSAWGGECTCPDGSKYMVSDDDSSCKKLECVGGKPSSCSPRGLHDNDFGAKVMCSIDFVSAMQIALADPLRDHDCWHSPSGSNERRMEQFPRFIRPRFFDSCPGFAPEFWYSVDMEDAFHGAFHRKTVNYKPDAPAFPDFIDFYDRFYETSAGNICRSTFGPEREGGPAFVIDPILVIEHSQ